MFTNIKMIDYKRPLAARAKARKVCGPYEWSPSQPGKGRGFYQASDALACDPRGSTFRLRLFSPDSFAECPARLDGVYYMADDCGTDFRPILAKLPRSRGWLAGWTMGNGMIASLGATIYSDAREAILAAHGDAEQAASEEREYREEEERKEREEEEREEAEERRRNDPNVTEATAPAAWASALINGDYSGLTTEEALAASAWLAEHAGWSVVGTVPDDAEGYFSRHFDLHAGKRYRELFPGITGGTVIDYQLLRNKLV